MLHPHLGSSLYASGLTLPILKMTKNSSNFYHHTASLQGVLHERELQQYTLSQLGRPFPLHSTSNKMDMQSPLYKYWQKILEDERKNDERNRTVLRKWENLEYRISVMAAKTEKLKLLKEKYFSLLQQLYLHGGNQREGWSVATGISSSTSNYKSPSEFYKENQYGLDYVHSQRQYNKSSAFKHTERPTSFTPVDSGITQMQNSYSELGTPRTVCEAAVQTDNALYILCQNCGQQTPIVDTRTIKHDNNFHLATNSFQHAEFTGFERFSSIPLHSSPFTPPFLSGYHAKTEDSIVRSMYTKDINNKLIPLSSERHGFDIQQNDHQNHRSEFLSEKSPPSATPRLNVQKHAGTQYSPSRSAGQSIYSAAVEVNAPLSELNLPEKNKTQFFGTRSATLSNVSSISSQNGAIKIKETESGVELVLEDASVPYSSSSDIIATKETATHSEAGKTKALKGKSFEDNMKVSEDESLVHHKILSPINSNSDSSLVPNVANFSSEEKGSQYKDRKARIRNQTNKFSRQESVSSYCSDKGADNGEHSESHCKNPQMMETHHTISNLDNADKSSPVLMHDEQSPEFCKSKSPVEENENYTRQVNSAPSQNSAESNRQESNGSESIQNSSKLHDNSKSQIANSTGYIIHTNDRKNSISSEKSLNSVKNQSIKSLSGSAAVVENHKLQEKEAENIHHNERENKSEGISAHVDLRKESTKYKSSSSSDTTDVDEKLNDSDDSFFDKELPLNATSAYQMFLGRNMSLNSKNETNNDTDSGDDVENELAAAVLSEVPSKTQKNGDVMITETSPISLKSRSAVEKSPSKGSSAHQGSRSTTTTASVQPRTTTQGLSKATRKALSLDPDSDSEDGSPPAGHSTPAAGKPGDSDSDEFDFYD